MELPDLSERRARVAEALALAPDELLLVGAGEPVPLPEETDQTYPFRAHSEYLYLTGINQPGGVLAFDPAVPAGQGWVSFVTDVTEAERTWEAREQPPGETVLALEAWLSQRRGRKVVVLGAPLRGVRADPATVATAREKLTHARRPKDAVELSLLSRAATATAAGFAAAVPCLRPGVTERGVQIELEAGFFRAGADAVGYGTIVGAGSDAAVLHFQPSHRAIQAGDFVLIDAGAEVARYVIDVTRTYVAGRPPTAFQRDFYGVVLTAQEAAIARCRVGAEWKELHLQCAVDLTAGLVDLGLMRGAPESLVDQGAHRVFFPHGLGHLVGLGVRDASGRYPGRPKDPRPALENLRQDLPLAEGYVTTVEPGLYFIPAILDDPARREKWRDCIDWEAADGHRQLGGVRIEDNVLVTAEGPVVLTSAVPKAMTDGG